MVIYGLCICKCKPSVNAERLSYNGNINSSKMEMNCFDISLAVF